MTKHDERAAYVHALQLELHRSATEDVDTYIYLWPSKANGSRYDRFIAIEEFSDGSCSVYLNASEAGFKAKLLQLRRMANE
jgi:hypothetical protein